MLFHFSENADITCFNPRQKSNRLDLPPVVWAVDEVHQYGFYCPRNCPRIVISRYQTIEPELEEAFFGQTSAHLIIAMEQAWFERLRTTSIYRYSFVPDGFELFDDIAGYYISEEVTVPQRVVRITDPIAELCRPELGIEFRLVPSLYPLRDKILTSGLKDFSIHRFEYAALNMRN